MIPYEQFLTNKHIRATPVSITNPLRIDAPLFDFQRAAVEYCLHVGRCALFLDTGLGKSICELEFARQCIHATGKPALILTPLAIAAQMVGEARKFGYAARIIRKQVDAGAFINVCNYDMAEHLDFRAYGCLILDESSILKNHAGATARALVDMGANIPYRLCASATPAPNDHTELGMHAEFLGLLRSDEMLARWFMNDRENTKEWRLKGHAVKPFWEWVASWAVMAEKPSDLGDYSDTRYELPALDIREHIVNHVVDAAPGASGFFSVVSATNLHGVKRSTAAGRADLVQTIVQAEPDEAWAIWCDTDYEADELCRRLPGALDLRGSQSPAQKEASLLAFSTGANKRIITKPSLSGFGLNWQHCARTVFVGRSFSYETWYQAVRRFWRFGQARTVVVHLIFADGERHIDAILGNKSEKHASMKLEMRAATKRAMRIADQGTIYRPTKAGDLPAWL